jgi:hypothetical protein
MKIRTVLLAVAAASTLSTAAFAATDSRDISHPSNREQMLAGCQALESQYDSIVGGRLNATKAHKAEGLHAQGVNACESNNSDIGVMKLHQAVRILGAKPAA